MNKFHEEGCQFYLNSHQGHSTKMTAGSESQYRRKERHNGKSHRRMMYCIQQKLKNDYQFATNHRRDSRKKFFEHFWNFLN